MRNSQVEDHYAKILGPKAGKALHQLELGLSPTQILSPEQTAFIVRTLARFLSAEVCAKFFEALGGGKGLQKLDRAIATPSNVETTRGDFKLDSSLVEKGRELLDEYAGPFLALIKDQGATRDQAAERLGIRTAQVSYLVHALVDLGRVEVGKKARNGRPPVQFYRAVQQPDIVPTAKSTPVKTVEPPTSTTAPVEPPNPPPPPEPPSTDEQWRTWAWAKRLPSPNPLPFSWFTRAAFKEFGTAPDWPMVFTNVTLSPVFEGQSKPFKVDLEDQIVY